MLYEKTAVQTLKVPYTNFLYKIRLFLRPLVRLELFSVLQQRIMVKDAHLAHANMIVYLNMVMPLYESILGWRATRLTVHY